MKISTPEDALEEPTEPYLTGHPGLWGACEYLSRRECSGPVDDDNGSPLLYNSGVALLVH